MKHLSLAILLALSLPTAACSSSHSEYRGLEESASFTATQSRGCANFSLLSSTPSGCPLSRPFATGVTESVSIRLDDNRVTSVVVRALDPDVLAVTSQRLTSSSDRYAQFNAAVTAMRPGVTELRVESMSGALLDRIRVEVADATRITLRADTDVETPGTLSADQRTFTLRQGAHASITAQGIDAQGRMLLGNDAVQWTVADTSVVNLSWFLQSGTRVNDDRVYVDGRATGTATLTATLNRATATVQAVVTP